MRKIILGHLLLITISVFSQEKEIEVLRNEKIFGKRFVDSSEIKGTEYVFTERIHETYIDTTTGYLTAQLRGVSKNGKWLKSTGNIVQYDNKNRKVLWSKMIAYQSSNLQQFSNTMIYTIGNKSNCLDVSTGDELWEVKNNLYFVDPIDKIGIGYKFRSATGYSNDLEGIGLKDGNVVWQREINREYGWDDVFYTNDSTLIVVAAGLHAVNLKTGKGWDYHTITGKKDYTETAAVNAVGLAAGLLTGTFVMSTGHNLVRDLVSNTIIDSSNIYFASKEQLVKIDKQSGAIEWQYSFPNDLASQSSIFVNDSVVYMINKGMASMGYRHINFGKPFIAAFDRQTGTQKFLSLINVKEDPIVSYQIHDGILYLAFKNRIAKYSMETGNVLIEREFPKESFGELKYFVGNQAFITTQNGDLMSLPQSDSTKVFVFTNQGNTLTIDNELNITKTIAYDDLSINYLRKKDLRFIAKDKMTLIINDKGERIAEINATSKAFMIGNTLYDTKENIFVTIDLSGIVEEM